MDVLTSDIEFVDIRLVEESDTFIYACEVEGVTLYVETVADPSARELVDALLWAVKGV